MTSPTQLTLKRLRADGWMAAVVERWNQWSKIRQDLWGFVDIVAIRGDDSLFIQCTTNDNVSKRIAKMKLLASPYMVHRPPNRRVEVWGWAKKGQRGKRKTWEVRMVDWSDV